MRKLLFVPMAVFAALTWVNTAQASPLIFTGQDDGAGTGGPFPNSTASRNAFGLVASTFGPLNTITFENLATGFYSPIAAAPGVSITLSAPNDGAGFSGVSNTTFGNLFGFNVTPGGSQWLGSPEGSATFNFASPTHSFGVWLSGLQTIFTSSMTLTFNDGTSQTINPPINVSGGMQFYGFTDSGLVSAVTITNLSNDAWGMDDVVFNASAVPEPGSLLLLATGIAALARRRMKKSK